MVDWVLHMYRPLAKSRGTIWIVAEYLVMTSLGKNISHQKMKESFLAEPPSKKLK